MSQSHLTEAPRDSVEVVELDPTPTVVVRVSNYPMDRMRELFDGTFSALFPALEDVGIQPAGPAFSLHTRMPTETADMEVGLPVSAPLGAPVQAGELVLINSELPGGRAATISHVGSYEELGNAWGRFMGMVAGSGETPAFPFWEVYVTEPGPDVDPATLRTDLWTALEG